MHGRVRPGFSVPAIQKPARQQGDIVMPTRIRTAVLPADGPGTRLLPLTRAVPKELLPGPNCLSQLLECRDRDGDTQETTVPGAAPAKEASAA